MSLTGDEGPFSLTYSSYLSNSGTQIINSALHLQLTIFRQPLCTCNDLSSNCTANHRLSCQSSLIYFSTLSAVSKKPNKRLWNFYGISTEKKCGTFCRISTESQKFHKKFHRHAAVEIFPLLMDPADEEGGGGGAGKERSAREEVRSR